MGYQKWVINIVSNGEPPNLPIPDTTIVLLREHGLNNPIKHGVWNIWATVHPKTFTLIWQPTTKHTKLPLFTAVSHSIEMLQSWAELPWMMNFKQLVP